MMELLTHSLSLGFQLLVVAGAFAFLRSLYRDLVKVFFEKEPS